MRKNIRYKTALNACEQWVDLIWDISAQLNTSKVCRKWTYDVMNYIIPNCEETKSGFSDSHGQFWRSEDWKRAMMINWQLQSYIDSYDHASQSVACSYDHCIGGVTIILPENKTSLKLHIYRVFCLVTNDDKSHIYICVQIVCVSVVCKYHNQTRPELTFADVRHLVWS